MTRRANWVAAGILIYFVILAATYAAYTPFFEAPDEGSHFLYVQHLLETGQLPIIEDRETVFASGFPQRHHPPLYYMIASLLIRWTNRDDLDDHRIVNPFAVAGVLQPDNVNGYLHPWSPATDGSVLALNLGRLVSIALSAGTVWLIYDIAWQAFGRTSVALLAMLLAASVPTFVFISASMNNDNLVTLAYTAGLAWLVRSWNHAHVSRRSMALLGGLLAVVALSKLNGVNLFGVVYLTLLVGALHGRFRWRNVLATICVSLLVALLLAGWWYLRNYVLYGDALAVNVTRAIWGRGVPPTEWNAILAEAWGVWVSFWLVLGKFNIAGPDWFYPYVTALTMLSVVGMLRFWWTQFVHRAYINMLLLAFMLVVGSLIITTRSINASQGRVLFPGLGPLVIFISAGFLLGWRRRITLVLLLPLIVMTLSVPITILSRAYGQLRPVDSAPVDAGRLDARVGAMVWHAYHLHQPTLAPGDTFNVDLYFSGIYPRDLVILAKLLDPLSPVELGGTQIFPGMTFTSQLPPGDTLYRVPVAFTVDSPVESLAPRQLRLFLDVLDGGQALNEQLVKIPWQDENGADLPGSLNVPGPILLDPAYMPPTPVVKTAVRFGDGITLDGFTLTTDRFEPGGGLGVSLLWAYHQSMARDWTVTLGLFDADNEIVVQADGMPPGYPTSSAWPGTVFPDERWLSIPPDITPGAYWLFVGWYAGAERLPIADELNVDNLYIIPEPLAISPP